MSEGGPETSGDEPDRVNVVFNMLRNENLLIDANIVSSDGVVFPVHKVVLTGHSSFFRAMFTSPIQQDDSKQVVLSTVGSQELEVIINYIYEQKLAVSSENVTKLLRAADYLSVLEVHKKCVEFLQRSINPTNCISILHFARRNFLNNLEQVAHMFLLRNFPQVAENCVDILNLPVDELIPVLSSDLLDVRNEEIVWNFVLKWVGHDKENRLIHLDKLLRCIRLGLMEVQYFLESVKNHEYVVGNQACRPVIIDTLKVLMDVQTITQKEGVVQTPDCAKPRIPHVVLFAIGGWSGGSPTNAVETYDTRADRWINVVEVDPAGPRAYHSTAVIGHDIYVIGGFDGMENFNSCRKFNAVSKTWSEVAPMHERRCYVSVVVLDNVIYALGGYNGHHRLNTGERYNHVINQWTMIAPMNVQRSDSSATVHNGKIYITGGFDGSQCLSSAEVYDPQTNVWTLLPPMRSRRSGVSCIAYHDCIYVIGGFNGASRLASGEKYVVALNQWVVLPDMYTTRSNFAIEVIDDMVFAIGGFNGIATIHQVECFDDSTNEWYEATDMNVFRSALSACIVSDLPNIHNYIHQNRHMLMEEKRLKLLALGQNNPGSNDPEENSALMNITQAMEEVNNLANRMDVDSGNVTDQEISEDEEEM